jgi:hypothetical protein
MKHFNMLRACFWLLAAVLMFQSFDITTGALTCYYMFITGVAKIGECSTYTDRVITIWAEMLATILALLLAARNGPPNDKEPS